MNQKEAKAFADEPELTDEEELEAIRVANVDLRSRADAEGIEIQYYADVDLLWIGIGKPKPHIGWDIPADVLLICFYEEENHKLNGFEVVSFKQGLEAHPSQNPLWQYLKNKIDHGLTGTFCPPPTDREMIVRELVKHFAPSA